MRDKWANKPLFFLALSNAYKEQTVSVALHQGKNAATNRDKSRSMGEHHNG